jgi:hypothetical protein
MGGAVNADANRQVMDLILQFSTSMLTGCLQMQWQGVRSRRTLQQLHVALN